MNPELHLAILFQSTPPPDIEGVAGQMKDGRSADSGADLAFALQEGGVDVITAVRDPRIVRDLDWVFPDSAAGIRDALGKGADTLWLNMILYRDHPVAEYLFKGGWVVGQDPKLVQEFDHKLILNQELLKAGLPVAAHQLLAEEDGARSGFSFPFILKPVRGCGSEGVVVINSPEQLAALRRAGSSLDTGNSFYAEEYLPGDEITVAVMPPGIYEIFGEEITNSGHWCLTPVKRFNHQHGIIPSEYRVAVADNSRVIGTNELGSNPVQHALRACESAATIVGARAAISIDCRQDSSGVYRLFDVNLNPRMTGPSRPHRFDQDSLVALAAADLGWNYTDLLLNMLRQRWRRG